MIDMNKSIQLVFEKIFTKSKNNFVPSLVKFLPVSGIDSVEKLSAFLAQCGHESACFTIFSENLNYSRESLLKVFPKYFNSINVDKYARKPILIANKVYANRMGNGDEASGDGWKYRGRGCIQITGKNNYDTFKKDTNKENFEVDYLLSVDGAIESAVWFWKKNNCNNFSNDMIKLTKIINGGTIGLEDRINLNNKIKSILSK